MVLLGFPLTVVVSMDMVSFNALHLSINRVRAKQREEEAWALAICTQGDVKAIKKLTKSWMREAQIGPEDDGEEIAKRFGQAGH